MRAALLLLPALLALPGCITAEQHRAGMAGVSGALRSNPAMFTPSRPAYVSPKQVTCRTVPDGFGALRTTCT